MALLALLTLLQWFVCNEQGIRPMMNQIRHELAHMRPVFVALAICLHLHKQQRCYGRMATTQMAVFRTV